MGTNYFVSKKPSLIGILQGGETEELHLGKSSVGWCFSLRIYPERGLVNLESWYRYMASGRTIITDEYGGEHELESIIDRIVNRRFNAHSTPKDSSRRQFHKDGCQRHRISEVCKPGKGPYDLCNYEFS